jgi:hypothetical protein
VLAAFGPPEGRDPMGVVARRDLAYVRAEQLFRSGNAADSSLTPTAHTASRLRPIPRPMLAAGAVFGVFVAATLALWAYYGSTVFFETIAAGIAACL